MVGFLAGFLEVEGREGFLVVDGDDGFSSAWGFELDVGFGRVDVELELGFGFVLEGLDGFVGVSRAVVATGLLEDDEVGFVELLGRLVLVGFFDGLDTGFVVEVASYVDTAAVSCSMTVGLAVVGFLMLVDELDVELDGFLLPLGRFFFFFVTGLVVELVVFTFTVVVVGISSVVVVVETVVGDAAKVRFFRSFRMASSSSKLPLKDSTILLTSMLTLSSSLIPEKFSILVMLLIMVESVRLRLGFLTGGKLLTSSGVV